MIGRHVTRLNRAFARRNRGCPAARQTIRAEVRMLIRVIRILMDN